MTGRSSDSDCRETRAVVVLPRQIRFLMLTVCGLWLLSDSCRTIKILGSAWRPRIGSPEKRQGQTNRACDDPFDCLATVD